MVDYTRKITHTAYKNPEKVKKYYHRVPKMIYKKFPPFEKGFDKTYLVVEDFIIKTDLGFAPWVYGILGGGYFYL